MNKIKNGSKLTVIICKNKINIQKDIENGINRITVQRTSNIVILNLLINNKNTYIYKQRYIIRIKKYEAGSYGNEDSNS